MLNNSWYYVADPTKQPHYQYVEEYTYWNVLGSLNNWNTIKFTNKYTSSEDFDAMHKVVIDGISDNITSLVQLGKYGSIIAADTTTMS